jgi:hypothetical protein
LPFGLIASAAGCLSAAVLSMLVQVPAPAALTQPANVRPPVVASRLKTPIA